MVPINAKLQTSAFLKDGTFDWHILKLVWLGRERQGYLFWVFLKEAGLNGRKPHSHSVSRSLMGPGHARPTRGLDPRWMEANSGSQSPTMRHVPPWAPTSGAP